MLASKVVIFIIYLIHEGSCTGDYNDVLENLARLSGSEIVFLTDQPDANDVLDRTRLQVSMPMKVFTVSTLFDEMRPNVCPEVDDMDNHFMEEVFFREKFGSQTTLFVVYVKNDVDKMVAILDGSVTECPLVVERGVYAQDNHFLFLVNPYDSIGVFSENLLTKSKYLKSHSHVSIFKRFENTPPKFLVFQLDLGLDAKSLARFTYIWDRSNQPKTLEVDFYANVTRDFRGHKFYMQIMNTESSLYYCAGNPKPYEVAKDTDDSLSKMGCGGVAGGLMRFSEEVLNFTSVVYRPKWLWTNRFDKKTGKFTGYISEVLDGRALFQGLTQNNLAYRRITAGMPLTYIGRD